MAGKTGVVVLAKADVGLGNADNTSDLDKPISTATQAALIDKADTASLGDLASMDAGNVNKPVVVTLPGGYTGIGAPIKLSRTPATYRLAPLTQGTDFQP